MIFPLTELRPYMTTDRPSVKLIPARTGRLAFLNRLWPWLLLAASAITFVVVFTPGFYLATMYTETVFLPILYQDIAVAHHPSTDWAWGGDSALFPDVLLYFGLNSVFSDGGLCLQLLLICSFFGWLMATVALVVELGRPHKLALCSMLLLLWVGFMCNFGYPDGRGLTIERSLLQPIYHTSTGLFSLVCLTILIHLIARGYGIGFWWLAVLTFLLSASDALFEVVFVGSSLVTLCLLALAFRVNWKWYLALAGTIAVAGGGGYLSAQHLFGPHLETGNYVHFSWDGIHSALLSIMAEASRPEHRIFAIGLVLDALTMIGGLAGLIFFCFSSRRKYIPPVAFGLMAYCSCCIFANWGAVIMTGDYVDIFANRYTTVALIIPFFLIVFGLHAIISWRPWLETIFAVAISVFVFSAAFFPQEPSGNYQGVMADIPVLKKIMKEHDIHACLGNYWCAAIVTFLSHNDVPVRALGSDATIYRSFNSMEWFGKGHPPSEWPHFRLIYGPLESCRTLFGKPDEIFKMPSGSEAWIYSDARSIRYNEVFDVLSNNLLDNGMTIRLQVAGLPGGPKVDGNTRFAIDGDAETWLVYGPFLQLPPGRYCATYNYTISVPSVKGKEPTFDILESKGDDHKSRYEQPLPCWTKGTHAFKQDFTVAKAGNTYEMRLFYHGTGTIRVDSLDVTYYGK